MQVEVFLRNKITRQINQNGQPLKFTRYKVNEYGEETQDIDEEFEFNGIFHEGGGYGGMLNIELYERDGARTITKMKPMVLCLYEDGVNLKMDDTVIISGNIYKVVAKNNVKNLNVVFDISLEEKNYG